MYNLGDRIKKLRIEAGLTQPDLAKMVGVTNGVISFWVNNVNEPKASYIRKLAEIFAVSSDYILELSDY